MSPLVTMEANQVLKRAAPLGIVGLAGADILNGRPAGVQVFEQVIRHLQSLPAEQILPLDFQGVKFLDYSCADEIFGKVLARINRGELEGKFVVIQNASETVLENIGMALRERDLCCPALDGEGTIRVAGKISDPLLRTYKLALERRTVTTGDVGEHFRQENLATSAASNRLVALGKMGLLYKVEEGPSEHGGRQYVYVAVG